LAKAERLASAVEATLASRSEGYQVTPALQL
jgi:hypothetical protein